MTVNFKRFTQKLFSVRNYSTIEKSVYISTSNDIYTNLALEDWFYQNLKTENRHTLMLWQNKPCVVIGKFQNPWLEANISNLSHIGEGGVDFARRSSGGGTVYHDMGNLNLTFFTSKKDYSRKRNLTFIKDVLSKHFSINVEINKREDLVVNDHKISGTAAKLGRLTAYHHCTVLVNVNSNNLKKALQTQDGNITTNASKSVKSKVLNLQNLNNIITVEHLLTSLAKEYSNNVHVITPNEDNFQGITETKETFQSWNWCFGKTPKFTICRKFQVPNDIYISGANEKLDISVLVENGIINDVTLILPVDLINNEFDHNFTVINNLKGQRFSDNLLSELENMFMYGEKSSKFVLECFKKTVTNQI